MLPCVWSEQRWPLPLLGTGWLLVNLLSPAAYSPSSSFVYFLSPLSTLPSPNLCGSALPKMGWDVFSISQERHRHFDSCPLQEKATENIKVANMGKSAWWRTLGPWSVLHTSGLAAAIPLRTLLSVFTPLSSSNLTIFFLNTGFESLISGMSQFQPKEEIWRIFL